MPAHRQEPHFARQLASLTGLADTLPEHRQANNSYAGGDTMVMGTCHCNSQKSQSFFFQKARVGLPALGLGSLKKDKCLATAPNKNKNL